MPASVGLLKHLLKQSAEQPEPQGNYNDIQSSYHAAIAAMYAPLGQPTRSDSHIESRASTAPSAVEGGARAGLIASPSGERDSRAVALHLSERERRAVAVGREPASLHFTPAQAPSPCSRKSDGSGAVASHLLDRDLKGLPSLEGLGGGSRAVQVDSLPDGRDSMAGLETASMGPSLSFMLQTPGGAAGADTRADFSR